MVREKPLEQNTRPIQCLWHRHWRLCQKGFCLINFHYLGHQLMKSDTINECVNETVSSLPHLKHSQPFQCKIVLTQSMAFLRCREILLFLSKFPTPIYCVSAACHSEHNMSSVLEFLPFYTCRMLAFFLQWSWLNWQKCQYLIYWFKSAVILVTDMNCKNSIITPCKKILFRRNLIWLSGNFDVNNTETIVTRCSDFSYWGRNGDVFRLSLHPSG
jgi:hypothetical protein